MLVERFEERCWSAELHRLRGVFLMAIGADKRQIEVRSGQPSVPRKSRSRFR